MAWTAESRRAHRERNLESIRKADRIRKRSYGGICEDCGAPTDGSNGRAKAPRYCANCIGPHLQTWTRDKIIAALQHYYATYGECVSSMLGAGNFRNYSPERLAEFRERFETGSYPTVTTVQARFGSWSAGMRAAGIPRQYGGRPLVATDTGEKICATEGCGKRLSKYNKSDQCYACASAEIEAIQARQRDKEERRLARIPPLLNGDEPITLGPPDQTPESFFKCRVHGCQEPARKDSIHLKKNRWSYLCDEHYNAEIQAASAAARNQHPAAERAAKPAARKPGPKKGERVNGAKAPAAPTGTRREIVDRISGVADQLDDIERQRLTLVERERILGDELADLCRALGAAR